MRERKRKRERAREREKERARESERERESERVREREREKERESASHRACLQNLILICLMVSGSQKSQISCQLFMRLFSGAIDAPCLINHSLPRCDYMLEVLMGPPEFSASAIKGVLTNSRGKM